MDYLRDNLEIVRAEIALACGRCDRDPDSVTLVAVSKYVSIDEALALRDCGVIDFGENRLPGALDKRDALHPARVHFIGHLQTNKVNKVVGQFHVIHSLDRESLREAIESRAAKLDIKQRCFVQVNVSGEDSKGGIEPDQLASFLKVVRGSPHIQLEGLMTMAPNIDNESELRAVFAKLKQLADLHDLTGLSMGMSNDYVLAVEEGATVVRVGSRLFNHN